MTQLPYLNLGSGRTKFPGTRLDHHQIAPEAIYSYPKWLNISRNASENPDCVMDLFAYPWALESNAYDGALIAHLAEHIDHTAHINYSPSKEIRIMSNGDIQSLDYSMYNFDWEQRAKELTLCQNGWYAFFSELHRVLTPGALVHIIAPYAWSQGAIHDPDHKRLLTPDSFTHSMKPDPNAPFEYATGGLHFEMQGFTYGLSPFFAHLAPRADDTPDILARKNAALEDALQTRINVVSEFYVCLRCVK